MSTMCNSPHVLLCQFPACPHAAPAENALGEVTLNIGMTVIDHARGSALNEVAVCNASFCSHFPQFTEIRSITYKTVIRMICKYQFNISLSGLQHPGRIGFNFHIYSNPCNTCRLQSFEVFHLHVTDPANAHPG